MEEQLKQKYLQYLKLFKQFFKFGKLFNSLENNFLPKNKEKLLNLENLQCYYSKNGKEQWQLIETDDKEINIMLKKFDTSYNLKICNADIKSLPNKTIEEVSNNTNIDENSVAIFEIHNFKKGYKYYVEIVVAKESGKIYLVERDWTYSISDGKWNIECANMELNNENINNI